MAFVGYLGDTVDATSTVVDELGDLPSAPTMLELGEIVARTLASDEPRSQVVVTVVPADGDPGEVTIDVIGLGDDAVRGLRAHVFGSPDFGATSWTRSKSHPCAGEASPTTAPTSDPTSRVPGS